jgi:predicted nucleotidyltransferase
LLLLVYVGSRHDAQNTDDPGAPLITVPNFQEFLDRTVAKLQLDNRFVGVAVAGSWITKTTDEFSDLDLIIVCDDEPYEAILQERKAIASSLGQRIGAFTGEHVGEPRLLICLYENPVLHVDMKFIKLNDLLERIEDPVVAWQCEGKISREMSKQPAKHPMPDLQWIEDRFWVWVHYAGTKLGRGELFEVIGFLSLIRGTVLGPLSLAKHAQLPPGSRRLETLAKSDFDDLRETVAPYDRTACFSAIEASIRLYEKLRERMDDGTLNRNLRGEKVLLQYLRSLK